MYALARTAMPTTNPKIIKNIKKNLLIYVNL